MSEFDNADRRNGYIVSSDLIPHPSEDILRRFAAPLTVNEDRGIEDQPLGLILILVPRRPVGRLAISNDFFHIFREICIQNRLMA